MTERELTKLVLKCLGALKTSKNLDLRITSTSYAKGSVSDDKKIVYHIIYYNDRISKTIDLDFYLNILDNINTPEEQIALGRNIIARIYFQVKA